MKIYVADDESNIREAIRTFLESEGYTVLAFENGDALLDHFKAHHQTDGADLVILDVMMPGSNGFTVCSELRKISTVPIIMLTARDSDLDYATGLSLGSDDYFTKPFSAMALVARVKAIFRRIEFEKHSNHCEDSVKLGDITIDRGKKSVTVNQQLVELTPYEYSLLCYLAENKQRAVSREELLKEVWGFEVSVETRTADETVRRLRKKLAASSVVIDSVWGFGYRVIENA